MPVRVHTAYCAATNVTVLAWDAKCTSSSTSPEMLTLELSFTPTELKLNEKIQEDYEVLNSLEVLSCFKKYRLLPYTVTFPRLKKLFLLVFPPSTKFRMSYKHLLLSRPLLFNQDLNSSATADGPRPLNSNDRRSGHYEFQYFSSSSLSCNVKAAFQKSKTSNTEQC